MPVSSGLAAIGRPQSQLTIDLLATILRLTSAGWNVVRQSKLVTSSTRETEIAGLLVEAIQEILDNLSVPLNLRFEEEVGTRSPGARKPDGRIDVKVIYSFHSKAFFGMECKRVRGKRVSLARKYVEEGVMRFVSGKYGAGHDWGGMIGFVVDGNVDDAANKLSSFLANYPQAALSLAWNADVSWNMAEAIYRTAHKQSPAQNTIAILHVLLA